MNTDIKTGFKPGVMSRLLTDASHMMIKSPLVTPIVQKTMEGGATGATLEQTLKELQANNPNIPSFMQQFTARAFVKLFIFSLSMFLAAKLAGSPAIVNTISEHTGVKNNQDASFKSLYYTHFIMLCLLITFYIIFHIILSYIPYIAFLIYFYWNKSPVDDVWQLAKDSANNVMDNFVCKEGIGKMDAYTILEIIAIVGGILFFLIYVLFEKQFLYNLKYIKYVENGNEELSQQNKFYMFIALTTIYILIFMTVVFTFIFTENEIMTLFIVVIVAFMFALFISCACMYILKQESMKHILLMTCVAFLVGGYYTYVTDYRGIFILLMCILYPVFFSNVLVMLWKKIWID
jgi:hypothetical protein